MPLYFERSREISEKFPREIVTVQIKSFLGLYWIKIEK